MRDREGTSKIALLGGDTIVGHALSLLLKGCGYELTILEAPPTGVPEELLGGVDLLLISPGLTRGRREQSLALLRGERTKMGVPVLEPSSAIRGGLLHEGGEVGVVPWPINMEGLVREIEGALQAAVGGQARAALGAGDQLAEGEAAL